MEGGDSAPTRRERERETHRDAILAAAEAEFASRGYAGATIAGIATRAEFSVGSIYNFFPGKRELAGAVMLRIARERVERLRALVLPLAGRPEEGLDALLRAWAAHHAQHGAFVRMGMDYQRSIGRRDPPEELRRLFAEYRGAVEEFFARAAASGAFRDLPPKDLARACEGICHELRFDMERSCAAEGGPVAEAELLARLRAVVPALLRR